MAARPRPEGWDVKDAEARVWHYTAWNALRPALATECLPRADADTVIDRLLALRPPAHELISLARDITRPSLACALADALTTSGRYATVAVRLLDNAALPAVRRRELAAHVATHARGTLKREAHWIGDSQMVDLGDDLSNAILRLAAPSRVLPTHLSDPLACRADWAATAARRALSLLRHHPGYAARALVLAHPGSATPAALRARLGRAAATIAATDGELPGVHVSHQKRVRAALSLTARVGRLERLTDLALADLTDAELTLLVDISDDQDAFTRAVLAELPRRDVYTRGAVLDVLDERVSELATRHPAAVDAILATFDTAVLIARCGRRTPRRPPVRPAGRRETAPTPKAGSVGQAVRSRLRQLALAGDEAAFARLEELADDAVALTDQETARLPWSVVRDSRPHLLQPLLLRAYQVAGRAGVATVEQVEQNCPAPLAHMEAALLAALDPADA